MTQPTIGRKSWRLRSVPAHLADRYRTDGWWTDATLGEMVADGLGAMGHAGFRVRSGVRPWTGTFADVDRAARSLGAELRARGVGPGSVVVFQLPNWVEAGITFWAAAYVGAVVVPIVHFYGGKEVEYIVRDDPEDKRLTTDGRALPGVELRLEESGEIVSRGPDCCRGYTDPDLTASVFDDDGWYRTGDVGVLDDRGYLTITDRVSDIIIRGGENISAQEVEELVLAVDGVAEVSVVAAPDERLGERAAAIVRLRPGAALPSLAHVREHLASAGLARQKWPESLHVVEEFPRTPSGKVQKFRLRQQLRQGRLGT